MQMCGGGRIFGDRICSWKTIFIIILPHNGELFSENPTYFLYYLPTGSQNILIWKIVPVQKYVGFSEKKGSS